MPRRCVFTVLYGPYDSLPPVGTGSGLPHIAFMDCDSPPPEAQAWEIRRLPQRLAGDTVRSARFVKLHPHLVLPEFDESLYLDCSVRLRQAPEALFAALLDAQPHAMACFAHSHRSCVQDEVRAVLALGYDDPGIIRRQIEAYAAQGLRGSGPLVWTGLLLRRHHEPGMVRFNTLWWEQVLRFSRRDQIAFPFLAEREGFAVQVHPIDNEESDFHTWPVPRDRPRAPWRPAVPAAGGALSKLIGELSASPAVDGPPAAARAEV